MTTLNIVGVADSLLSSDKAHLSYFKFEDLIILLVSRFEVLVNRLTGVLCKVAKVVSKKRRKMKSHFLVPTDLAHAIKLHGIDVSQIADYRTF